jgi:hypothetical protein
MRVEISRPNLNFAKKWPAIAKEGLAKPQC